MGSLRLKTNFRRKKISKKARKKHVETMFLTQNEKKFPFYYKSTIRSVENNVNNFFIERKRFYIKATKSGLLTIGTLKAIVRIYKWFAKTYKIEDLTIFNLLIFPDFAFTSKPKDVRMGKGKGPVSKKLAVYKRGQNIAFFKFKVPTAKAFLANELLRKIIFKLPKGFVISKKVW